MEFTAISRVENEKLVVYINDPNAVPSTQYACYLYETKKEGILVKQMFVNQRTFSFDLAETGRYYARVFVRNWPNGPQGEPVITKQYTNIVSFQKKWVSQGKNYPTKMLTYDQVDGEDFCSARGIIYDILWNGVHFEFFIDHKPNCQQAVILGTGDVGGVKCKPYFSRISWSKELPGTAIYYSDPTVYLGESTLGWGYGTNDRWYLEEIAVLLKKILDKLNIPTSNTLFQGSSAGGFTAMGLAAMLRSRATVINPQFTVENFWPRLVNIMKKTCLKKGETLLSDRTHVISIFENQSYFPLLHIVENLKSDSDFNMQLIPFLKELTEMNVSCSDRMYMEFYSDPGGHTAMPPKETCLRHIAEDLARPLPDGDIPGEASLLSRIEKGEFDQLKSTPAAPWTAEDEKKLYIILTVDTEDKYEDVPNLIECDFGDEGNCGVNYIMDQLEQRGMRGVFFTNIYEHTNFHGDYGDYMERLVKRLSSRGHEVALHTHLNKALNFYSKSLYSSNYEEQRKIIQYGTDFIEKYAGKRPIAHRGGAYHCNDTTFQVLSDLGYKIESSSFYTDTGTGNRFHHFRSLNQPIKIKGLIEFPVVSVYNQSGMPRKLDPNHLDDTAIIAAIEQMKQRPNFNAAQLMFHSFSFVDQKGTPECEPKFCSGPKKVYGINTALTKRFERVLDYLRDDPQIEIVTFEEYLSKNIKLPPIWGDGPFWANTEAARKSAFEFVGKRNNPRYCLDDTFQDQATQQPCCNFDECNLPRPSLYTLGHQAKTYANDLMNGKLRVYPRIEPMNYSLDTLDFGIQFSNIPLTFQLYLQALNPVQTLVLAYENTHNPNYLSFAYQFIRKWESYASVPSNISSNPFVFNDHAVALRAENLMYFGQICCKVGIWSDDLYEYLYKLLLKHGEWLYNDAHYTKQHNHGIMQDQALLHLGYVLNRQEWVAQAKKRLLIQEQWAFNEEMVHTENSCGYALGVSELLSKIARFLQSNDDPLGEKLLQDMKKTQEFIDWTMQPNGIRAQVGDTNGKPGILYGNEEDMRRHTPEEHKFYPLSGYYFYRSNRGDESRCDTWKLLKSGYVQMAHKHSDDCSFILYSKGYEIFVDCGIYGYTKDAFRTYFTSALAHNTVIVDGTTYPCDKNHTHCAGMRGYHAFPDYDHVRVFNDAYNGVKFQRDFCSADDLTLIVDTLESRSKHTYSQLFHLGEKMELVRADDKEVLIRLADSGYRVRLRQFGDPVKLELIRGNKEKPGLGLISRGEGHLATITTLKFDLVGSSGVFATAITIEDENGLVRLGDVKAPAEALRYDAAAETFTLGELTIPFHDLPSEDAHPGRTPGDPAVTGGQKAAGTALKSKCSLSIYGSCVSRDVLTIANDTKFDLKAYIARQSVISAVAPKIPEGAIPLENSSAFRKRVVESDLRKNAFELLKANKSDYFMLDLIDERFPLLRLFGSYVTASSEFYESAPKKYRLMDKLEKRLEDGKLYLGDYCVEDAVKEFCTRLKEIYAPEQIILHCASMLDYYRSKSGELTMFKPSKITANHQINAVMEAMCSRIQSYLPGLHVIQEIDGIVADENHKWGLATMHYQQEYYARVLARLYEIAGL